MDEINDDPLNIVLSELRFSAPAMGEEAVEPPTPPQHAHTSPENEGAGELDPISAIASVAGVLAIAVNLVKVVYSAAQSARHYCKELTLLGDEIATLMGLLFALKQSLGVPFAASSDAGTPSLESPTPSTPSSQSSRSSFSDAGYELINLGKAQAYLADQLLKEIVACQSTLEEVDTFLSKASPTRRRSLTNVTRQLTWSLKKMDIRTFTDKLERHKLTFVLILSSQGT